MSDSAQMCCVNAIVTDFNTGIQDSIYRCMNKYVTETDYDVKINEYAFALKCVDQRGMSTSSSMPKLSAIMSSMLLLLLLSTTF